MGPLILIVVCALGIIGGAIWLYKIDSPTIPPASEIAQKVVVVQNASLTLRFFGDMRAPERLAYDNVFRWYYLRNMIVVVEKITGKQESHLIGNLFLTFENPVIIGTLTVTSPDMKLPTYEVKDFNPRSAVVAFTGEIPAGTLIMRVHQ